MKQGLLGKKVGMMRLFQDDGASIPVTVIDVSTNTVVDVSSVGSSVSVVVGFEDVLPKRISKAELGVFVSKELVPKKHLMTFSYPASFANLQTGDTLSESLFEQGSFVDVSGITLGKGFTGTIKRHNFASGRASHGNSRSHNVPGSIGMAQDPGRVFPGKKMCGHDGAAQRTVQNLKVIKVDANRHLVFVKGAIPGAKGQVVVVRKAVKKLGVL